ncbi:MAG: EscU/YscU/HrcU family type III secretion system export apparatus switch protein, partial [Planctomycetes bacterium]|nr:EscU/YscU/HrcU family type III secretion system export apparatus switch protein [Planctomycetota bacterium]
CAAVGAFYTVGPMLWMEGKDVVRDAMAQLPASALEQGTKYYFVGLIEAASWRFLPIALAFIGPLYLVAMLGGYSQIGVRVTPKAVNMDLSKLSPLKGMKKVFSMRGVVRTGLAIGKITAISVAALSALWMQRDGITALTAMDLPVVLARVVVILGKAAMAGVAAALILAVVDLAYQRFQHAKDMRMSKKEIKDENKNTEGDPQIKARIRAVQREMAANRMMQDVPEATVVVTNPTHFAVALKYDPTDPHKAPIVVAKGMDLVAQTIKRIAAEAGVPVIESPPLARSLHRLVEIGDEIPEELFEAVAKILAFVLNPQLTRPNMAGTVN